MDFQPTAGVIRVFERLGWATKVRWPTPARLECHRAPLAAGGGRIR
jgi:fatty-acid desaturase